MVCSFLTRYPIRWTAQRPSHYIADRPVHSDTNSTYQEEFSTLTLLCEELGEDTCGHVYRHEETLKVGLYFRRRQAL